MNNIVKGITIGALSIAGGAVMNNNKVNACEYPKAVVVADVLNVRSTPEVTPYNKIGKLKSKDVVDVLSTVHNGFVKVTFNNGYDVGWVSKTYLLGYTENYQPVNKPVAKEERYRTTANVWLRETPNGNKITVLTNYSEVIKLGTSGNWTKVKYVKTGKVGYVSSKYLKFYR